MTYYRQDGKPTRHTVTKPNAILSWDLRNPGATPEQRAKAMAEIEKRFARREPPNSSFSTFAPFSINSTPLLPGQFFQVFEDKS